MVFTQSLKLTSLVLFSAKDKIWKIADFGITVEGTSNLLTTTYARGTSCYRAPELLSDIPRYTTKVDIWGVGCILFEMMTGQKAFSGDWSVQQFAHSHMPLNVPQRSFGLDNQKLVDLVVFILDVDWYQRPEVRQIKAAILDSVADTLKRAAIDLESVHPRVPLCLECPRILLCQVDHVLDV